MKKYFLIVLAFAFTLSSCENQKEKTITGADGDDPVADEYIVVNLKDFHSQAENLVGKTIRITGTVDHVCKHGGQKMVIVSRDTDKRLKIFTGENMAAFNTKLEGENVMVTGVVEEERVDENYLREWEEEVKSSKEIKNEQDKLHTGQGHEDNEKQNDRSAELEQINNLRKKLNESGKDHLSFYSMVCKDYEVIDIDESAPENE